MEYNKQASEQSRIDPAYFEESGFDTWAEQQTLRDLRKWVPLEEAPLYEATGGTVTCFEIRRIGKRYPLQRVRVKDGRRKGWLRYRLLDENGDRFTFYVNHKLVTKVHNQIKHL